MSYFPAGYFPTASSGTVTNNGGTVGGTYPPLFEDVSLVAPVMSLDPAYQRSLIYASPLSERIRWWKAVHDPNNDEAQGKVNTSGGTDKWLREEQDVSTYRAIVGNTKIARKYFPQGDVMEGDIAITTMAGEIGLGDHDWVMPIGVNDTTWRGLPDYRTTEHKEQVVRGGDETVMTGTVSSFGSTVTGTGTDFTQYRAGDVLKAGNQQLVVSTVVSVTQLTTVSGASPALSGNSHKRGRERLQFTPAVYLLRVLTSSRGYTYLTEVSLASDEATLKWIDPSIAPNPGQRISLAYDVRNLYLVQFDLGSDRHVVNGSSMTSTVLCRLQSNDGFKRV